MVWSFLSIFHSNAFLKINKNSDCYCIQHGRAAPLPTLHRIYCSCRCAAPPSPIAVTSQDELSLFGTPTQLVQPRIMGECHRSSSTSTYLPAASFSLELSLFRLDDDDDGESSRRPAGFPVIIVAIAVVVVVVVAIITAALRSRHGDRLIGDAAALPDDHRHRDTRAARRAREDLLVRAQDDVRDPSSSSPTSSRRSR